MDYRLDSHGGLAMEVPDVPRLSLRAPILAGPLDLSDLPALPPLEVDADGWLRGELVVREPEGIKSGTGWAEGHPVAVLNHFTVGCGDPHGTLVERGVSAHGCTLRDLTLAQYVPFTRLSFHAYDQARYSIGWENAVSPGTCDWTVGMLARLAQLNAAVIRWVEEHYGYAIPAERKSGGDLRAAGIKCHADGLAPGATWDPRGHWDAPWQASGDAIVAWVSPAQQAALDRSPWSSGDFVAAVRHYLTGGDEMTDEQKAMLAEALSKARDADEFVGGVNDRRSAKPMPAEGPRRNGWRFADEAFKRPAAGSGGVPRDEYDEHVHGGAATGPPVKAS